MASQPPSKRRFRASTAPVGRLKRKTHLSGNSSLSAYKLAHFETESLEARKRFLSRVTLTGRVSPEARNTRDTSPSSYNQRCPLHTAGSAKSPPNFEGVRSHALNVPEEAPFRSPTLQGTLPSAKACRASEGREVSVSTKWQ